MKRRYSIVLGALLSTTVGIGLSNATVQPPGTLTPSAQTRPLAQVFQFMAAGDYQSATAVLTDLSQKIEQFSPSQQFDIWYFSAVSLSQQPEQERETEVLNLFDNAFELAGTAEQHQLSRALQTATALAISYEQPEKLFHYVTLWQTFSTDIPVETQFYLAVAHYQLQQFSEAAVQLESLIKAVESRGEDAKDRWYNLLVATYSSLGDYTKSYDVQQKAEALYPNNKNQRILSDLKLTLQNM